MLEVDGLSRLGYQYWKCRFRPSSRHIVKPDKSGVGSRMFWVGEKCAYSAGHRRLTVWLMYLIKAKLMPY